MLLRLAQNHIFLTALSVLVATLYLNLWWEQVIDHTNIHLKPQND